MKINRDYLSVPDEVKKYREAARRLGLRWMRRRSQKGANLSWSAYHRYLESYPLPMPGRLTDLIAMTRTQ